MAKKSSDVIEDDVTKTLIKSVGQRGTPLENERWEIYSRYRCQGFTKSDSYRMAFQTESIYASQMANDLERENPEVKARIAELTDEYTKLVLEFNPEQSLARWDALYAAAIAKGDVKAAITIQANIDKLSGIGVATEKKKASDGNANLTFSDPRDWRAGAQKMLEALNHKSVNPEEALAVVNEARKGLEKKLVGDERYNSHNVDES